MKDRRQTTEDRRQEAALRPFDKLRAGKLRTGGQPFGQDLSKRPADELRSSRSGLGKQLPQFEEIAIRARPGTLPFWQVFLIDSGAGSGVS